MCESHAELWANIMNVIFTIIESKIKLTVDLLGALLSFEYIFSKIQSQKIYKMIIEKKSTTLAKGYFIYKYLLLENLDKYLEIVGVGDPIFSFPVENNDKFKFFITKIIENYKNSNLNIPKSLNETLRMTCVEI